jgi:predicted DNA-binding transcriptional regulator YafY
MPKSKQVNRILILLKMLSEGHHLSMNTKEQAHHILLKDLDVGKRSLQIDMNTIKEYLGDNLIYSDKTYKLVKKEYLENFFQDNYLELKKFFHAISLIDKSVFGENFKRYKHILDDIKEEQKGVYLFLENPFENLKHLALKEELEAYIQKRNYIDIEYMTDELFKFKRVQAYKIIYQNGNWYLAVLTTEDYAVNNGFRLLRLNFIKKIIPCRFEPYHFHEDLQVKAFLEHKFQSLFTSFDKEFFTVKVKVSSVIARHFKVKKFLKSQKILKCIDENLIVEFSINDDMEIIPLVQMWMPHLKVLEPLRIHEKIMRNIEKY